ncbi:MAG: hypothetical protein ACREON_16715 [Gemmatimonadaceae bacterium]
MIAPRVVALLLMAALQLSCNPFRREQAVEITTSDIPLNARWNGTLGTPSTLAGAVQIRGSTWMGSPEGSSSTTAEVRVSNATPGGRHPWHVHQGQCGSDGGIWGDASDYGTIAIDNDGNGSARATIDLPTPSSGNYYVNVHAAPNNLGTIVACGNLAPPSR